MHLAQLNIAVPRFPLDDPRIAPFMDNLNRINGLAQRMPGFVWMHKDDTGHAMYQPTPWPDAAANLSVWTDAKALEHFAWNTVHRAFYRRKHEWFETMETHHFVMWHVPEGHRPTLGEAKGRLDRLDANGDTDEAFGWGHLPHVKLWRERRCG